MAKVRLFLLAVLLPAALWLGVSAFLRAGETFEMLRSWRRFAARVTSTTDPHTITVEIERRDKTIELRVPRNTDAGYRPQSFVEILEHPERETDRRLNEFFDLWDPVLGRLFLAIALGAAAAVIWMRQWGAPREWSQLTKRWVVVTDSNEGQQTGGPAVREPARAWLVSALWSLLGLALAVAMILPLRTGNLLVRSAIGVAGVAWFLVHLGRAIRHGTRVVRADDAGLEEITAFGRRRVLWRVIGEVEYQDARKSLSEAASRKARKRQARIGMPKMHAHVVRDKRKNPLLRLDWAMQPSESLANLLDRVNQAAAYNAKFGVNPESTGQRR